MRKVNKMRRREALAGWGFVLACVISLLLFTIIPVAMSLYVSFTNWTGYTKFGTAAWVGFRHYTNLLSGLMQADFWRSIVNTLVMMLYVPIGLFLSLLLAMALNSDLPAKGVFRVIYYIPCITNAVAVTILFNKMFSEAGVINSFLNGMGLSSISWLTRPGPAKVMIVILLIWKGLGYNMLLFLAGLQGVSKEYYEAAMLDGAGPVRRFVSLTIPLIRPIMFYMFVTGIVGALQIYTEPAIMFPYSNGMGPEHGTVTLLVLLYYQYGQGNLGVASAVAWVLTILIIVVTAIQFYINSRRERYDEGAR